MWRPPRAADRAGAARYGVRVSDERGDDPGTTREMREGLPSGEPEPQEEEENASSPFDHPAFLPVILVAVALWFGFDGWFNEEIESVRFNRYGFGFLLGAALYFTLDEVTRFPYLTALLFLGYALWLGAFLFGSAAGGTTRWSACRARVSAT